MTQAPDRLRCLTAATEGGGQRREPGERIEPGPAAESAPGPAAHLLRCLRVERQTADVKTFVFAPAQGGGFAWRPGQYLTFGMDVAGQALNRCYTISSAPGPCSRVEITVKRLPTGAVSTWLHDSVVPGTVLEAHGPLGGFTPETQENCAVVPKYLFLAAGSGITPLMSITRALLGSPGRSDVVLLNSIHSPSDLIFGAELLALPTGGGMRVEVICSSADRYGLATGVPASPGRLNPGLLRRLVPDLTEREVFCCGPPGYLAAVRAMLEEAGCDPRRRHEESFEIGDQPGAQPGGGTAPPPVPAQAPAGFAVEFARTGRTIDCGPETNVLDAALAAGVMLPSSCGQGLCGTCKSDLLRGTVEMNHAGGIRPREIAQGKILICCSTPTADLVIDA